VQVYNDLMPWQASGISQKLIKQSFYEGYLKRLDPLRYSGAPLAIIDGRVYLTHGPLEKDTNDFILGKLHDLQVQTARMPNTACSPPGSAAGKRLLEETERGTESWSKIADVKDARACHSLLRLMHDLLSRLPAIRTKTGGGVLRTHARA
jgi:hypothetical protein